MIGAGGDKPPAPCVFRPDCGSHRPSGTLLPGATPDLR